MFTKKTLIWCLILFLTAFVWFGCSSRETARPVELSVLFMDVGQGDATLISLPNGKYILIDTGDGANPHSERDAGRDIVGPFLRRNGIEFIDYLILTHPHRDHLGGTLEFLYQIRVGEILISGETATARYYENLMRYIQQRNISLRAVARGEKLDVDIDNLHIEFLHPDDYKKYRNVNNVSVVTYIRFGNVGYIISGDAETEVEESIIAAYPDLTAQILRTGHHGSSTSSSQKFIDSIKPEVAIISCAEKNRFNHPSRQVVNRFERMQIELYKTFVHGHIEILTDGETYRVITQR